MGTYHPYLIDEETNELRGEWLVQGQLKWLKTSQVWSPGLFTPRPKSVNPQHIPVCPRPSQERLTPENRAWWPGLMDNLFLFALDHHKSKKSPENSAWWAGPMGTSSASSASTTWHLLLSSAAVNISHISSLSFHHTWCNSGRGKHKQNWNQL